MGYRCSVLDKLVESLNIINGKFKIGIVEYKLVSGKGVEFIVVGSVFIFNESENGDGLWLVVFDG